MLGQQKRAGEQRGRRSRGAREKPGHGVGERVSGESPLRGRGLARGPAQLARVGGAFRLAAHSAVRLGQAAADAGVGRAVAMASLLCCGPKMAACGIVLSAWGVIMLVGTGTGGWRRCCCCWVGAPGVAPGQP